MLLLPEDQNFVLFEWDAAKNEKLLEERGLSFDDVVKAIRTGKLLDVYDHPNKERFPNQRIYVLDIGGYACLCPHERRDKSIHLITVFPNRKATELYLKGERT